MIARATKQLVVWLATREIMPWPWADAILRRFNLGAL